MVSFESEADSSSSFSENEPINLKRKKPPAQKDPIKATEELKDLLMSKPSSEAATTEPAEDSPSLWNPSKR